MHPTNLRHNFGVTGGVRSQLSGGSFKSGFLGSAVSYGASWSGAYEAVGVSSQANTWAQRAQNLLVTTSKAVRANESPLKSLPC
jgi:hypothetical protein